MREALGRARIRRSVDVGIDAHLVAQLAAEQLIGRYAERLAATIALASGDCAISAALASRNQAMSNTLRPRRRSSKRFSHAIVSTSCPLCDASPMPVRPLLAFNRTMIQSPRLFTGRRKTSRLSIIVACRGAATPALAARAAGPIAIPINSARRSTAQARRSMRNVANGCNAAIAAIGAGGRQRN
ncbi:hypothetical protein [Sphingomonas bacterium]|uniref:hypothetical protein n=1 Tax=Sphingomonas bacterium TaxID=1895847 RepID=UPI0015774E00|nr:hypothetical protein [Sphingomonas bacterium]